ncbi:uncharacterized protein LOC144650560 [Oculina patagonica]
MTLCFIRFRVGQEISTLHAAGDIVHASSFPTHCRMSGRLTTAQLLMWDFTFGANVIEFLMDMMTGSARRTILIGCQKATGLEDGPCTVILVHSRLSMTVLEFIETAMGCCM